MMKRIIFLILIFLSNLSYSQSAQIDSSFIGKWANEKVGINIYRDKVIMLVKNPSWIDSPKNEDKYTFESTRVKTPDTFESWVINYKPNKEYKGGRYQQIPTKQLRIFRFEKKGSTLKFYISNVARLYDTDKTSYYINGITPDKGFINVFELFKQEEVSH